MRASPFSTSSVPYLPVYSFRCFPFLTSCPPGPSPPSEPLRAAPAGGGEGEGGGEGGAATASALAAGRGAYRARARLAGGLRGSPAIAIARRPALSAQITAAAALPTRHLPATPPRSLHPPLPSPRSR
ncbi:hypothetical protein R5R35_012027 [Gryllus longicercus]|uniref:Uncharacterized protein n=1 Tax=Gryllus longicercus TaxID=2509291 RepID=A0AAN9VHZ9_9ORTH